MMEAVCIYLEKAKTLAELAGAAPLAAELEMPEPIRGKQNALILNGGNITPEQLRQVLDVDGNNLTAVEKERGQVIARGEIIEG